MIHRFHTAARDGRDEVVLWGTGRPRREFLHSDDLGRAVVHLLDGYDDPEIINVGRGQDLEVGELATHVAAAVRFTGRITWDSTRPDGTPRKLLDVSRITALGWAPRVELADGIRDTYQWYLTHVAGESPADPCLSR
jgi:GDP-L-fucose synthase